MKRYTARIKMLEKDPWIEKQFENRASAEEWAKKWGLFDSQIIDNEGNINNDIQRI